MMNTPSPHSFKILLAGILVLTASCTPSPMATPSAITSPTHTSISIPTEMVIPLAALVNGDPITQEEFEAELARYQASRGTDLATDINDAEVVISAMIERFLLVQGARSSGLEVEESNFLMELERLITDMGGQEAYQRWMEENHFTASSFEQALMNDMLAAKMVSKISSDVPSSELHANARHILLTSQEEAERLRQEILAGADFADLAVLYSMDLSTRPAGGDLGWLARGTLTMPNVEDVIFQLEPGEMSEVIASELGYHIVQLIGLENRTLSYETLLRRQEQAVENWINEKWDRAEIENYITH